MAASLTALSRERFMLLKQLSLSHSINMVRHIAFRASQSYMIPLSSLHNGEVCSFPGSAPPSDTVNCESVVGVKPSDSSVVNRYHVDELQFSVECFIA